MSRARIAFELETMVDLTNFNLVDLPTAESDTFEFKSSSTSVNDLNKKLACAVSGFGNSGGGCFVAGINGTGDADGGFPRKIGNQDLRDWADQIIHQVETTPPYEIKVVDDPNGRGVVNPGNCVLIVSIKESFSAPHMAPDGRYYIRAGAHTVRARHFLVDAIWAKRHIAKPRLTHVFRPKPSCQQAIQLGVVALTPAPAVEVDISLSPLPDMLRGGDKYFPLKIPVIDCENPFFFDVTTWFQAEERFGENVQLSVAYKDIANNSYVYETPISISSSIAPLIIGSDPNEKMANSLESIEKLLKKIVK